MTSHDNTADGLLVEIHGKLVATYKGLLAKAHDEGLRTVSTEILQFPSADNGNTCIVRATVQTEKGTFQGIGDANPDNVKRMVVSHSIRMAETRAKSRAFRDAVNVGVVSEDELKSLRPDEDAAAALRKAKIKLVRRVADLRREYHADTTIPAGDLIRRIVADLLGGATEIANEDELAEVEEAIESGVFDLSTGERIPDTEPPPAPGDEYDDETPLPDEQRELYRRD